MSTAPFLPSRPFYSPDSAIDRTSNGRYAVETYRRHTGAVAVSVECPDGSSVNGGLYGEDSPRFDFPERLPAYVKREARRLLFAAVNVHHGVHTR